MWSVTARSMVCGLNGVGGRIAKQTRVPRVARVPDTGPETVTVQSQKMEEPIVWVRRDVKTANWSQKKLF